MPTMSTSPEATVREMQPRLSVLIPVRSESNLLEAKVRELVDILADEVGLFEILLLEQSPNELASESAATLAAQYTQVRRVRVPSNLALDSSASLAAGQVVLIHDGDELDLAGIIRIYRRECGQTKTPAPSERLRDSFKGRTLLSRDQLASAIIHRQEPVIRVATSGRRPMERSGAEYRRGPASWNNA